MDWSVALVVATAGYLIGSISFARLVVRLARPGSSVARIEVPLASGDTFVSDMVSATAVRVALGPRDGLLTAALDMANWAGMVLLIPWLWLASGSPWYLAYAVFVVGAYFIALRPELAQYARLIREGRDPTNEEIAGVFAMGRRLRQAIDRHAPLPALGRRLRGAAGSN